MKDIRENCTEELVLTIANDSYYYFMRKKKAFLTIISEDFLYTEQQLIELKEWMKYEGEDS